MFLVHLLNPINQERNAGLLALSTACLLTWKSVCSKKYSVVQATVEAVTVIAERNVQLTRSKLVDGKMQLKEKNDACSVKMDRPKRNHNDMRNLTCFKTAKQKQRTHKDV